jgi:hypothetical protein
MAEGIQGLDLFQHPEVFASPAGGRFAMQAWLPA